MADDPWTLRFCVEDALKVGERAFAPSDSWLLASGS